MPPSILLYRTTWIILLIPRLFLLLVTLKEKSPSSFTTCFRVSAEGNERKSEKKRERDSFFFFYSLSRFVSAFVYNQRLDRFHIVRYIFIPTYLHVIGAVCVTIKHAFPMFITTPIAASFSSQWNINKLLHRITRSESNRSVHSKLDELLINHGDGLFRSICLRND